jgi:hypothetical protein
MPIEKGISRGLSSGRRPHPSLSSVDIASLTVAFHAVSASTRAFKVSKERIVWADLLGSL